MKCKNEVVERIITADVKNKKNLYLKQKKSSRPIKFGVSARELKTV